MAIAGINEGVADLMAHYSLEEHGQNTLTGLNCFSYRDLKEKNLGTKGEKVLSSAFIQAYFVSTVEEDSSCGSPSFQNEHTLGAIFAYGARKALDILPFSNEYKMNIVLNWLNKLNTYYPEESSLSGEFYLEQAAVHFSKQLRSAAVGYEEPICTSLEERFSRVHFSGGAKSSD